MTWYIFYNKFQTINNKILLDDTAYDSIKLRYQVEKILVSLIISTKNKKI